MSDLLSLLQTRRSLAPQRMTGPGPTDADIATMLKIASRVPDHGKLAPWRFIVIKGEARQRIGEQLEAIYAADNPSADEDRRKIERARLTRAPVVIAVVSKAAPHVKIPEWEQLMSAGAACMNLVWAANALDFATAWLTEWFAYDRRALAHFGVKPDEKIVGFVHIGRRTEPADERPRPDLAQIVSEL
ncbi:MAG: nitroreductase [Rhizobiales bacterium 65-9]|nr:nitroreductase [Hyphomicrobiales bacterium]OJY33816.1 MAG: nitroreductase [Rhizobiales bacterium 65-9]